MNNRGEPEVDQHQGSDQLMTRRRYRRLLLYLFLSISIVSVAPLVIMTWANYHQYEEAFHTEQLRPIVRFTSNAKHSLEFFLKERLSALSLVVNETSLKDLSDQKRLNRLLRHMKNAFGGFIDLGLVDADGRQVSYAGPYKLQDKNYKEHDWFHEVSRNGVSISDVFLGYRKLPHFVIAVRHDVPDSESYVIRATIDTELINRQILGLQLQPSSEAFIVNRKGVLQTPSRGFGDVLEICTLTVPPYSHGAEVMEILDEKGKPLIVGYAYIESSPFILMLVAYKGEMQGSWLSLRRELAIFLSISVVLILGVVFLGSKYMVKRLREADMKRAEIMHNMEYTSRMAVIGRLAAGVAHEINNPLAIINEKAGLLDDLFSMSEEAPPKGKVLKTISSIINSVDRCSKITRRLLRFAKHMDVHQEQINVNLLLEEVVSFLEKEAHYRGIQVTFQIPENLPTIESDRGQLQQVFLNIVNNAFAAVEEGGQVEISAEETENKRLAVSIADNGSGIPEENLSHIFEPFFTTAKGHGTGLGLSITYGIVNKLGGEIHVKSQVGEGTNFTVIMPVKTNLS
ncbi:MAG: two-component sensor histidine kinase [Proteobacteria bacterium]|nr:two-component sensor histidine kinase [Pseudomonadota bacterium]